MAEVILKKVNKIYGGKNHVIKDADLEIKDREFLVLVGPSGCGKSTLLRMVAGLEEITSGEIEIGGRIVNDLAPKDRDIAMVFQNYALYPHMNVYNNMGFGLKIRKFQKSEIDERVNEAAEILGLEKLLVRKPRELSGGQKQRVALGRAIVRKPKVFLFDEPLSNLDAKLRVHMRTEIGKLHQKLQTTMIYVTHDQVEAMTMGDRIAVLNNGIVQQHNTPLELYNEPANLFVAGFIGSPAMNFIPATTSENMLYADDIKLELPAEIPAGEVMLGIRPEYFVIDENSPHFKVEVEVVEPMGSETFIYFSLAGNQVVARVTAHNEIKIKQIVPFSIDIAHMKLFNPETGEKIRI